MEGRFLLQKFAVEVIVTSSGARDDLRVVHKHFSKRDNASPIAEGPAYRAHEPLSVSVWDETKVDVHVSKS